MMITGLCDSPITFHAIIQWSEALNNGEMQLREILDLDAMLSKEPPVDKMTDDADGDDDGEISEETAGPTIREDDDDEPRKRRPIPMRMMRKARHASVKRRTRRTNTLSLAQMEAALKPEALERFARIADLFGKFEKIQQERVDVLGRGDDFPAAKERKYENLREELTAEVESVQFHATKIEFLVDNLYAFNRRLTTLGGQMLRLAERHRVKRRDFLDAYVGNELDENWIANSAKKPTR
jgi:RNA polymerase primary sigma factor